MNAALQSRVAGTRAMRTTPVQLGGWHMTVTIRSVNEADRAAWDVLWQGYLAFYKVTLEPSVTEATWRRLIDPTEDMHALGAIDGTGAMTGIVHYLYHPVTWSIAPRCYLEDLYVAGAARGTGAGRALIEAVYAAADARGADQVYWLTQADNDTARRLYDRIGRPTPFVKYQR